MLRVAGGPLSRLSIPASRGAHLSVGRVSHGACDVLRGGQIAGINCRNGIPGVLGCHHLGGGHAHGLFPSHGLICWCCGGSVSLLREHCAAVTLFRFLELVIFIRTRKLYPVVTLPISTLSLSFSQWPYVGLYLGPRECYLPLENPDGTHQGIPSPTQCPRFHPRSLWPH